MQKRLDPETSVDEPFENISCQGRIQNFFQGGGTKFRHFFKCSFFLAELILGSVYFAVDGKIAFRSILP